MTRGWWWKFLFLIAITLFSAAYVYPTLSDLDPQKTKFPFTQKINLGLDLQGGLYMVMGVEFNKVFRDIVERQAGSLESRMKDKGLPVTSVKTLKEGLPEDDPQIAIEFDPSKHDAIRAMIKEEYWNFRLV